MTVFSSLLSKILLEERPRGPMVKALDYESRDCMFDSCRGLFFYPFWPGNKIDKLQTQVRVTIQVRVRV